MQQKKDKDKNIKRYIKTALYAFAILLLIYIALPILIFSDFLGRHYDQFQCKANDYGVEAESISLQTEDSLSLAAWRVYADNSKGTVIILSGIQEPSVTAFFGYARMFADNGWDSLLIEMRGRSNSEGNEIGLGYKEWLDVKAGVDYIKGDDAKKPLPIVVMGTSMGASTAIVAAGELPEIDGIISVSAFSSWPNMFQSYMSKYHIPKFLSSIQKPFVNLFLGFKFGFSTVNYTPVNAIAKLNGRPVLLMHSTNDSQVPYAEYEILKSEIEDNDINAEYLVREGDHHFVIDMHYFDNPAGDTEFSQTILEYLSNNFSAPPTINPSQ